MVLVNVAEVFSFLDGNQLRTQVVAGNEILIGNKIADHLLRKISQVVGWDVFIYRAIFKGKKLDIMDKTPKIRFTYNISLKLEGHVRRDSLRNTQKYRLINKRIIPWKRNLASIFIYFSLIREWEIGNVWDENFTVCNPV